MRTAIVYGNDPPEWRSAAQRASDLAGTSVYQQAPYINKNASRVVLGTFKPDVARGEVPRFQTVMKATVRGTVADAVGYYRRARPEPGFDRQTANRTNYELGSERIRYETNAMFSNNDPRARPLRAQPRYRVVGRDEGMRTFEGGRRCNGMQGAARADLGVDYNLITGTDDAGQRGRVRAGARTSLNRLELQATRQGFAGGAPAGGPQTAGPCTYDPVFGRMKPTAGPPTLL
eukprot:g3209.t1